MFSSEGNARSHRQNRIVAGCLALVGGFVNSAGFVLIGTFTSHVTGNVGRLGNDAARGDYMAAAGALTMILSFFGGAFLASVIIESQFFGRRSRAYAAALGMETVLLVAFTVASQLTTRTELVLRDAQAILLCMAMGLQNALVTRLSGAVVRTTHLTGVVTDLGIETARWFRHWRWRISQSARVRLLFGPDAPERPSAEKFALLATIGSCFLAGAYVGVISALHIGPKAVLVAALAVASCGGYALRDDSKHKADPAVSRR